MAGLADYADYAVQNEAEMTPLMQKVIADEYMKAHGGELHGANSPYSRRVRNDWQKVTDYVNNLPNQRDYNVPDKLSQLHKYEFGQPKGQMFLDFDETVGDNTANGAEHRVMKEFDNLTMGLADKDKAFSTLAKEVWERTDTPLLPGAREGLQAMFNKGIRPIIVTARKEQYRDAVEKSLINAGIDPRDVDIICTGSSKKKKATFDALRTTKGIFDGVSSFGSVGDAPRDNAGYGPHFNIYQPHMY